VEYSVEIPPKISLPGLYPKESKLGSQRDIYTVLFIAALFTAAKT
jgi:hypothetical protein